MAGERPIIVPDSQTVADVYRQAEFRQERLLMAERGLAWRRVEFVRLAIQLGVFTDRLGRESDASDSAR